MWLALSLALLFALAASARRFLRAGSEKRRRSRLPGAGPDSAIRVSSYNEIDEHLEARRCPCGGKYMSLGEGTAEQGEACIRVVRVECKRCEELGWLYFDTSRVPLSPTLH